MLHGLSRIKHAITDKHPSHLRIGVNESKFLSMLEAYGGKIIQEAHDIFEISYGGNNYILRQIGSDKAVFEEIFLKSEYQMLLKFIKINNISINTGVDIGANIGLATRYLLAELRPSFWMCIEPFEENMKLCKLNNSQYTNIQYRQAAFWHQEQAVVYLNRNFRDGADWAISVSSKPEGINLGPVPVVVMNEILTSPGFQKIDLLKIDIEGAEHIVFSDKATLNLLSNVLVLCIEVHQEPIGNKKLYDRLYSAGFYLFKSGNILLGINKDRANN